MTRPELWTPARGQLGLRLHNARASFVTVALLSGRPEEWGRRRSKHKSSAIENYRRDLGTFRELSLGAGVPLDIAIPELAAIVKAEEEAKAAAAFTDPRNRKRSGRLRDPNLSRGERIRTSDP